MAIKTSITVPVQGKDNEITLNHKEYEDFVTIVFVEDECLISSFRLNSEQIYSLIGALNKLKFKLNEK